MEVLKIWKNFPFTKGMKMFNVNSTLQISQEREQQAQGLVMSCEQQEQEQEVEVTV